MWNAGVYRRGLCCLVALLGALSLGWAATPEKEVAPGAARDDAGGKPRIQFDALKHDFGKVPSGQDLKTTFVFKNVGDEVLMIEKIKGG